MSLRNQFKKWVWPLAGAAVGIIIGGWITKGSPFEADWVSGLIIIAAFMVGRGIRQISGREVRSPDNGDLTT